MDDALHNVETNTCLSGLKPSKLKYTVTIQQMFNLLEVQALFLCCLQSSYVQTKTRKFRIFTNTVLDTKILVVCQNSKSEAAASSWFPLEAFTHLDTMCGLLGKL